jgi:transposase-like protein
MSASEIAQVMGISTMTVVRVRKRRGCQVAPPAEPFTTEELARVEALFADGCSCAEVARTIGRSPSAIRRRWPQHAWTKSQAGELAALTRLNRPYLRGV